MPGRSHLQTATLFFSSLILFTWGLSSQEIIGFDSRFYLFAQEMWRYGMSWFPMTYQHPYPDYPASSTLVIYLFAMLFGGVNKLTAVLPTAILAALTVTFTYLIGSLQHKRWGFYAAMLMLMTSAFIKNARGISLDMYPAAISVVCFYLLYSDEKKNYLLIYFLLFLGYAFRGPIGLVIPAGVMCSYYFINKEFKKLLLHGVFAFLLLVTCTVLLLFLAHHTGGDTFMNDVLRMEVLGRIDNYFQPRYYYFINSLGNYAPAYPLVWLVLPGAAYYAYQNKNISADQKLLLHLFGYMMIIMIGMSVPDDKKTRYILSMLPAAALIACYPFVAPSSQRYFMILRYVLRSLLFFLPLLICLLAFIFKSYVDVPNEALVFFSIVQMVNFFVKREMFFFGSAAISFIAVNIFIVEPVQLSMNKSRDFVATIEKQRLHDNLRLAFYREQPDSLPIKYLINMTSNDKPLFIQNQKELAHFSEPAYFVASESYYEELPQRIRNKFSVIAKDTLGHVKVVVFTKG